MRFIPYLSALFLSGVFLYGGIDKALHYDGFVNALTSYSAVPGALANLLAPVLILAELWIAVGLLWHRWRAAAAITAAGVLVLFTSALAANLGTPPGSLCGCWFTITLAKSTPIHLVQNLIFLGLALTVWRQAQEIPQAVAKAELRVDPC